VCVSEDCFLVGFWLLGRTRSCRPGYPPLLLFRFYVDDFSIILIVDCHRGSVAVYLRSPNWYWDPLVMRDCNCNLWFDKEMYSDYLSLYSVVLMYRQLSSNYPDLLCLLTYCRMRRPNALNLNVISMAMPHHDLLYLLIFCRMRRPNALNFDVIFNGALSWIWAIMWAFTPGIVIAVGFHVTCWWPFEGGRMHQLQWHGRYIIDPYLIQKLHCRWLYTQR